MVLFCFVLFVITLTDAGGMWVVKEAHKGEVCEAGSPISCGKKIRLEHAQTGKNLHSHLFQSPVSGQQEVSGYGANGDGDTGDNWEVVCDPGKAWWKRSDYIQFRHVDTGKFLVTSMKHKFDRRDSGHGCPIMGQTVVSCSSSREQNKIRWITTQGVCFPVEEEQTKDKEL